MVFDNNGLLVLRFRNSVWLRNLFCEGVAFFLGWDLIKDFLSCDIGVFLIKHRFGRSFKEFEKGLLIFDLDFWLKCLRFSLCLFYFYYGKGNPVGEDLVLFFRLRFSSVCPEEHLNALTSRAALVSHRNGLNLVRILFLMRISRCKGWEGLRFQARVERFFGVGFLYPFAD